uniref:CCR4-NOT transcription complex subunit 11 n=1 Tax=Meloidogyne javanica TaxID=6303 RepID=A0A915MG16_MELJA
MELLTSETDSSKGGLTSGNSFLNTLAKAEPSAEWLMNWLYDYQLRPLATPRLAEMIVEILDKSEQNSPKNDPTQKQTHNLWLFQFCLILRCLRVPSFQEFLLETVPSPSKFEELTIPSNSRERKIFDDELLATSMLLRKFFTDTNGQLIFCKEAQKIAIFISHLILASGEDRRFEYFNDIEQIESLINDIPNSLYLKKTEEMIENENDEDISYKLGNF